jgi:hypothetical protein
MRDSTSPVNVQQLCLRLKPILGSKADQIYEAYLAEDTEGKNQIEQYLALLAAKHIPQKLGETETILIPPSEKQAKGDYPIGSVCYAGKELYEFGLREDEWIQHVGVFGRSGAGKTNIGFAILNQLQQKGKPVLIFEPFAL